MSGKRDLNPRPPPWQGGALPLSYSRMCERRDLNPHTLRHQNLNLACLPVPPRSRNRSDQVQASDGAVNIILYPLPGNRPGHRMGERRGSNPRPPVPQTGALPTELRPPCFVPAVRQEGVEPPTHCLEGSCSIQLSYWHIRDDWI